MQIDLIADQEAIARRGAEILAQAASDAIRLRGQFLVAVSGGTAPWVMFAAFARQKVEWNKLHVFQVDERAAPDDDPDRNLKHLRESWLDHGSIPAENVHPMPVTEPDLQAAASEYARTLEQVAGPNPVLDLVHLGLGPDGHTASLVPGDPVLNVTDADVALTGIYQGRRRMTLTYPIINRSRRVLWLATGAEKAGMLARLQAGDVSIPAGRVSGDHAVILADRPAAGQVVKDSNTDVA